MGNKQPVSVLVLIHSADKQVLLLERCGFADGWQSVTGSREQQESLPEIAAREVWEETGIVCAEHTLCDWHLSNRYEIFPRWRDRYPAGVTHNTEHVFGLCVPRDIAVTLSGDEHTRWQWLPWAEAAMRVFSPSNAAAIRLLPSRHAEPP